MLTKLRFSHRDKYWKTYYWFKCFCDRMFCAREESILSKKTKSCGCLKQKLDKVKATAMGKANKTHGLYRTPTWKTWDSMNQRCNNAKSPDYKYYGAKGIRVN